MEDKKNNKAAKSAAKKAVETQQAPKTAPKAEEATNSDNVRVLNRKQVSGLSADSKVAYLAAVQKERDEIRNNAEDAPQTLIAGLTVIAQSTILDIAAGEIACGYSALGLIISRNENNYATFAAMASELGVTLPPFKSLPAPTKEQLAQAGLSGIDAGNAALIVIDDKSVSKEAKKKKKAEKAIQDKKQIDPTKIENEEQLKEQLTMCFLGNEHPVLRVQKAINFYNSYLTIQANKAENAEEELKKVKEMSRAEMLRKITEIIGECTFAMTGIAHFLNKAANETQGPVAPFCLYRRACNTAGEKAQADDSFVADMVKIIVIWSCNSKIAEHNRMIASCKKNIETLSADKKKNAASIKIEQAAITNHESEIVGIQSIIECVTSPKFDMVNSLEENYDAEEGSVRYNIAHRLVSNIIDTYYKGTRPEDYTKESLLKTAKYHIGTIINLFTDPLARSITYTDMEKPELVKVETKTEEETSTEEAKN